MQARASDSSGGNFAETCLYARTFLLKVPEILKTLLLTSQWRESGNYTKVVVHCIMESTISYLSLLGKMMASKSCEADSGDM